MGERAAHDRDEEWIARYRAALRGEPVKKSRFDDLCNATKTIGDQILIFAGRILTGLQRSEHRSREVNKNTAMGNGKRNRFPLSERARKTKAG